ncbi:MAG: hypothetical protein LQ340_006102 [Diploschistes diacapsis]|nr:MAG: hypothetical protein LQ340_006102 [Diploschistes diacapsis]
MLTLVSLQALFGNLLGSVKLIPTHLLRGPWTSEKRTRESFKSDADVAPHGLEDAIREYCVRAIVMLAILQGRHWYLYFFDAIPPVLNRRNEPLELNEESYSFKMRSDTTRPLYPPSGALFSIPMKDSHPRAALEAAEQMNDPNLKVFHWLLPFFELQQCGLGQFDLDQPEPLLGKWARDKKTVEKNKDITEETGAMVLNLLSEGKEFAVGV